MILHRRANNPPAGGHLHKFPTLCGLWLHPLASTTDADRVDCKVCIGATTSKRTIRRNRIARENS